MALYVKFECATCENENCMGHGLPTTEKVCDGYKHTTTNADRIRAMTDAELVDFFDRMMETLNPWCDHPCPNGEDSICRYCVIEWLNEEAKGDT